MPQRRNDSATQRSKIGTPDGSSHLEDLAVFVLVARATSFARAAQRAGLSTSSVSRAVARLEAKLGVRLLQRTSRTVACTEEGRQLCLQAGPLVDELQQALVLAADRRSQPVGVLRVTAPAFTGATRVASALAAFALAYPEISVELDATNTTRNLIEDGYDLAIRVGPVTDGDLVARKLWDVESALFVSRELIAPRPPYRVERAALERAPAVVTRASSVWRFLAPDGSRVEITPNARFVVNDPRAAVEAARQGLGYVLAPADAVSERDRALVRVRPSFGEPESREVFAAYPSRRLLPVRVRLALDWLAKH
ncbi:MAG TPA: LysR family transcriptional regulator [Polyangiaceae bacterium]|nr:LysR family transcriptional regulator [Polyangiaceae bacterium]